MNTARRWNLGFTGSKIVMALLLSAIIGSIDVAPAAADNDRNRGYQHDDRRYENRGHRNNRGHRVYKRRVYETHVYRERVYAPPPVYYAPPPPPGIGIFFPSITIRP